VAQQTETDKEAVFTAALHDALAYDPTQGQARLIHFLAKFLYSSKPNCTLVVRGYAGTGKTTLTGALVKVLRQLKVKTVLLAPTGRAAKVLSGHAAQTAHTIHRMIYVKHNEASNLQFSLGANRFKNAFFIVDEASMIGERKNDQNGEGFPSNLLDDLMSYVFSGENCRLMLIGDSAQLPPVGCDDSPALRYRDLANQYYLTAGEVELNEVVRQELDSGILFNANTLRLQLALKRDALPKLMLDGFDDVFRINGAELPDTYESLLSRFTDEGVIIITRSNKRANQFNQHIRERIFFREERLSGGDLLMVVRNNYFWLNGFKNAPTDFIANGDSLQVIRVVKYHERYQLHFADVEVQMLDYPDFQPFEVRVMLDVLTSDRPNLDFEQSKALYRLVAADYAHLGTKSAISNGVRNDPYNNALQIKYGYAVTCHKAQGGQWPAVIVDQGYLTEEHVDSGLLRWFYTAFTRARRELWLLNFSDDFFE